MNIALFGGAFDPPHIGHQQISRYVLETDRADQVWFVPVKNHAFGKTVTEDRHRRAMLELILPQNSKIEEYELHQAGVSLTAKTVAALAAAYPEHTFSWVIGADNLQQLDAWGGGLRDIIRQHVFWVYPRAGYDAAALIQQLAERGWLPADHQLRYLEDAPVVPAASTRIRELVEAQNGQVAAISDLVDPAVARYIENHELYQSFSPTAA